MVNDREDPEETARAAALQRIGERGWPGGLSTEDALALDRLPDDQIAAVARRLDAVLRWCEPSDADEPFADAAEAARAAGLAKTQFYQIAKEWRARRAVRSLGVIGKAGERRVSRVEKSKARVARTVARALAADAWASTSSLLAKIAELHPDAPSRTTVLRVIEAERRAASAGPFGARIVFDSAGLDLMDPEGLHVRLYVVLDAATNIVLGYAEVGGDPTATSYRFAAYMASECMHGVDLTGMAAASEGPVVEVRTIAGDVEGEEMFAGLGIAVTVPNGIDRLGRLVVGALGDRVGPVWIGTGTRPDGVGFRTGRAEKLRLMTSAMADTIAAAVHSANAARIRRARAAGGGPGIEAALGRVRSELTRIADLWPEPPDDR